MPPHPHPLPRDGGEGNVATMPKELSVIRFRLDFLRVWGEE